MKKDGTEDPDEILPEYDFSRARPNKYASRYPAGSNAVVANEPEALPLTPVQAEELAPLAALDLDLKGRILTYLRKVRDEFRVPMLYVSHDVDEVLALCEEVLVLDRGLLRGRGEPREVFGPHPSIPSPGRTPGPRYILEPKENLS